MRSFNQIWGKEQSLWDLFLKYPLPRHILYSCNGKKEPGLVRIFLGHLFLTMKTGLLYPRWQTSSNLLQEKVLTKEVSTKINCRDLLQLELSLHLNMKALMCPCRREFFSSSGKKKVLTSLAHSHSAAVVFWPRGYPTIEGRTNKPNWGHLEIGKL